MRHLILRGKAHMCVGRRGDSGANRGVGRKNIGEGTKGSGVGRRRDEER